VSVGLLDVLAQLASIICQKSSWGIANMGERIAAFLNDDEGLTIVEYAVAGALVAATVAAAFTTLGQAILAQIAALTGLVNA
jgi:pilus assembly protein Flp/PilA